MSGSTLTIKEVLQGAQGRWMGPVADLNRPVAKVVTDSRTIGSGDVFFALVGERFDGHDFVLQALQAGAVAVVVADEWYQQQQTLPQQPFFVVQDTLTAFQVAARAYRRRFNIPVIAITGSAGKTSTKEAIYHVLSQQYCVLRNKKSFNNHVGVPATLFELQPQHQILLTELGTNHFGELDRLSYLVEPQVVVLTNIGYAHLEFFKDLEGVLKAKTEIFNHCQKDGTAIFNADDGLLRNYRYPLSAIFSYALEHEADLTAKILGCNNLAAYRIELLGEEVQLPISGKHNIYNALAAAAVGLRFGLTPQQIKAGLESMTAIEKRMEVLTIDSVTILNDSYNANPNSCKAAMATLADMEIPPGGRRIAVLADMLELGAFTQIEHERLAEVFASLSLDILFLHGPATEDTWQQAKKLGIEAYHYPEKESLAHALANVIQPGDRVLIKGSRGMQMEEVVDLLREKLKNKKEKN